MAELLKRWTENLATSVARRSTSERDGSLTFMLKAAGVPPFRKARPLLAGEIQRARRYMHPLTVMLLSDGGCLEAAAQWTLGEEGLARDDVRAQLTVPAAAWPVLLAPVVREALRETDVVTYVAAQGHCIVLMPETSADEARQAMKRIAGLCETRLLLALRAGFAVFPQDGLTLEELVRYAEEQWQRSGPSILGDAKGGECE